MTSTATLPAEPKNTSSTATEKPELAHRFTALDRCDSCGSQAYISALVNGSELLFCAHHGHRFEDKLKAVSSEWYDESFRLDLDNVASQSSP